MTSTRSGWRSRATRAEQKVARLEADNARAQQEIQRLTERCRRLEGKLSDLSLQALELAERAHLYTEEGS